MTDKTISTLKSSQWHYRGIIDGKFGFEASDGTGIWHVVEHVYYLDDAHSMSTFEFWVDSNLNPKIVIVNENQVVVANRHGLKEVLSPRDQLPRFAKKRVLR